jgi:peptidoglycan-associated lipoprotein
VRRRRTFPDVSSLLSLRPIPKGMKTRRLDPVLVSAVAAGLVALLAGPGTADVKRFKARVFADRVRPAEFLPVDDFRVNETIGDEGGVQYFILRTQEGTFKMPFETVSEVLFTRLLEARDDIARYEATVLARDEDAPRTGLIELRVLRGVVHDVEWHLMPVTREERGARLFRIVFPDASGEYPEDLLEMPEPPPAPKPVPPPPPPPAATVVPRAASEADLFARKTLDQLNSEKPLADVFFDFDQSNLREEAQTTLRRNMDWLVKWPSTKVRIEGYCDIRGSNEYNLGLGDRRAEAVSAFLASLGVAADRMTAATMGKTEVFCTDQTEECWAKNRRARFVITAK